MFSLNGHSTTPLRALVIIAKNRLVEMQYNRAQISAMHVFRILINTFNPDKDLILEPSVYYTIQSSDSSIVPYLQFALELSVTV